MPCIVSILGKEFVCAYTMFVVLFVPVHLVVR